MQLATPQDLADLWLWLLASRANSWWGRGEGLRRCVGDVSYRLRPNPRGHVFARLSAATDLDLPADELRRITREILRTTWAEREIYWLRLLASEPEILSRIGDLVAVDGLDHLREALAAGRGAVLWECPFGNRPLGRFALAAEGVHVTVVHGPKHGGSLSRLGQHVVRRIYRAAEAQLPVEVVDVDENSTAYIELLTQRLRQNGVVCINGFGKMGRRSVALDFFGRRRGFATGAASLAISTGAALIPAFCYRDSRRRCHLALERPCPLGGNESAGGLQEKAVRYCAAALEKYVRRYPGQWLGWHEAL